MIRVLLNMLKKRKKTPVNNEEKTVNKNINIIKNTTNNLSKSGSFTTFKWYEYLNLFKYSSAVIFSSCLLFLI